MIIFLKAKYKFRWLWTKTNIDNAINIQLWTKLSLYLTQKYGHTYILGLNYREVLFFNSIFLKD